ncbi:hypothetical protein SAMN05216223_11496 [Actinacidiphila yanglinensis]|uniref:Uncharacterized protein n=1 Tax=Actinacidiphila yanglinensis TaxID=310779 RepID=A0A1H6DE73_9ACTN|nr:hypothetical protein SAMN05216223_11496 [Actinacidiphila yanglinensis]
MPERIATSVGSHNAQAARGPAGRRTSRVRCTAAMDDLAFIGLSILVFVVLGLISKGVGRL